MSLTDELSVAPQAAARPGSVEELLGVVKLLLSESLVSQVGACFQFHISSSDGQDSICYVDLSRGIGCLCLPEMYLEVWINCAAL